jgi:hypothetical protein
MRKDASDGCTIRPWPFAGLPLLLLLPKAAAPPPDNAVVGEFAGDAPSPVIGA